MGDLDKLWGGRFVGTTDTLMEELNKSIFYDKRMCQEDILGSQAYAKALENVQLLGEDEETAINGGLDAISKEWNEDKFVIKPTDEDIHTANERRLKELIGNPATKLHTGRSRNDQVATDMRLWLRAALASLNSHLVHLMKVLVQRATQEADILMPGYTHMQRAQPVRWSHWILSHAFALQADGDRLQQLRQRINTMPLGSGALAGTPFPIDRERLARDLGFARVSSNSMHAVADRDFIAEFLFWSSLVFVHLSRLAEDLILFSTKEFGFVQLADAYATGSSLMPQKKNPDSLELIRGKTGRVIGNCCGFLAVMKGLPMTYNKDMQEDKEAMFLNHDSLQSALQVMAGTVHTLQVNSQRCVDALSPEMLATDLAHYLVRRGIPFREAHRLSGVVVGKAEESGVEISQLSLADLQAISPVFGADVCGVWDYYASVEQYQAIGGTSKGSIQRQVAELNNWLLSIPQP